MRFYCPSFRGCATVRSVRVWFICTIHRHKKKIRRIPASTNIGHILYWLWFLKRSAKALKFSKFEDLWKIWFWYYALLFARTSKICKCIFIDYVDEWIQCRKIIYIYACHIPWLYLNFYDVQIFTEIHKRMFDCGQCHGYDSPQKHIAGVFRTKTHALELFFALCTIIIISLFILLFMVASFYRYLMREVIRF